MRRQGRVSNSVSTLFSLLLLAGCASSPTPLPHSTYFQQMDVVTELPSVRPVELPAPPEKTFAVLNGEEALVFFGPQADKLNEYVKALQANTEIAKAAAVVLEASEAERRALIEAGRATEQSRNLMADEVTRLEGKLNQSEFMRALEAWVHRVLIVGVILIGL